MSTSGTDLPASILYCRLCQSLYRQPRTLPCLHSFCTDCLRKLAPARDARGQATLLCFVCGRGCPMPYSGVSGFTPNDFLARMCQEYVGEVQRTIATGKPLSPPPTGPTSPTSILAGRAAGGGGYFQYTTTTTTSPRSQVQQVSPLASGVSASGAYSQAQAHSQAQAQAQPEQAVSPPPTTVKTRFDYAFRSSRKTSAEPSTAPSTTAPTPPAPITTHTGYQAITSTHVTSPRQSSSSSSDVVLQTARRVSASETIPTRGVGVQRRLSSTPRDVVRTWECLQRKLNNLHAASLQATYSLETVNMAEANWHQRKQDLRRDIQRRSAQLQFFVKRQERLLLAALDSRGTDDTFLTGADQARSDLRGNLKALMHEIDTLKSVLDLATDTELVSLSSLLLASTASQSQVTMETPELRFVVPEELSLEDMVSRDFGCLTSTPLSQVIFTPEEVDQGVPENQEEEEEGEDEAFVTDTYTMETPGAGAATTHTTYTRETPHAAASTKNVTAHSAPMTRSSTAATYGSARASTTYSSVTQPFQGSAVTTTTTTTTTGADHFENSIKDVAYIDDEEEDDEEEEVVVEETFEIIDGKMQVVSKKSFQAPRSQSTSRSSSQSREESTVRTLQRQEATTRPATATTTSTSAGAASSSSYGLKDQSTRGRGLDTRRTVNSALSGSYATREQTHQPSATEGSSSRTSVLTSTTGQTSQPGYQSERTSTTTTVLPTRKLGYQPTVATQEVVRESQQSPPQLSSPPPEPSEHQTTLNKFQNIREELAQKRRELLLNTSVYSLPSHPGVAHLLPKEKRVHSLDRTTTTTTLREGSRRSNSPASPQRRLTPAVAAPVHRTPRHSTDSEDSEHSSQSAHSDTVISRREPGSVLEETAVTSTILSTASSGPAEERTSRPVRRAISAASDKASKMEYLRETWQRRKELLIQNEAFIPAPPAKPEEDPPDPPPQEASEQDPAKGNGGKALAGTDKSTLKQSLRSKLSNIKQALKKNGKAEEGKLEAKVSDKPPSGKGAESSSTTFLAKDVRPAPPSSLTESAAEEKVLKTVETILQKRNVAIPQPAVPSLPLQPSLPDTSPSPNQTSPGGKPSMIVKPRPRDPSPAVSTVALGTPALETLEEDVVKVSSPSPKKKISLRMTSPVRGDANVEMNPKVKANIRRKKERWRSLSLT